MSGKSYGNLQSRRVDTSRRPPQPPAASIARAAAAFLFLAGATSPLVPSPSPSFAYHACCVSIDEAFTTYSEALPSEEGLLDACAYATRAFSLAVTVTSDFGEIPIPKTYKQAVESEHSEYWREAISKEIKGLIENDTWDLILASDMPSGANLMHCHPVFTVKRNSDGSIENSSVEWSPTETRRSMVLTSTESSQPW